MDVDNLTDMAVKAEEMGFDSVWVTDHIIVPHEIPDRPEIVYPHDMLEPLMEGEGEQERYSQGRYSDHGECA